MYTIQLGSKLLQTMETKTKLSMLSNFNALLDKYIYTAKKYLWQIVLCDE